MTWNEGVSLAGSRKIRLPVMVPTPLISLVPMASEEGINIMKEMLQWDPRKRPTAAQVFTRDTSSDGSITSSFGNN